MREVETRGGSTDMGDLTQIMPAIHPYAAGATGTGHGNDYYIKDYENAVLLPAKVMAMTVIDLLADDARQARGLLGEYQPRLSRSRVHGLPARAGQDHRIRRGDVLTGGRLDLPPGPFPGRRKGSTQGG